MCHIVLSLLLSHCWASTWVLLICMKAVQRLNAARLFLLGRQRKHCWLRGGGIRAGGKFNFPYEMPYGSSDNAEQRQRTGHPTSVYPVQSRESRPADDRSQPAHNTGRCHWSQACLQSVPLVFLFTLHNCSLQKYCPKGPIRASARRRMLVCVLPARSQMRTFFGESTGETILSREHAAEMQSHPG